MMANKLSEYYKNESLKKAIKYYNEGIKTSKSTAIYYAQLLADHFQKSFTIKIVDDDTAMIFKVEV